MEEEIILKLSGFLTKHAPMVEECHVVYLMAEIRKLLDIRRLTDRDTYLTLRLYCDWILHPIIDRAKLSSEMKELIDNIDKSILGGQVFNEKQLVPSDLGKALYEFMSFSKLKDNMELFFSKAELPNNLFENNNWMEFRNLLLKVLTEQPVIFKDPANNIESLCFKFAITGAAHLEINFKDGRPKFRSLTVLSII